jgi:hypothetical protein
MVLSSNIFHRGDVRVVWDDTAKGKSDVIIRTSGYE